MSTLGVVRFEQLWVEKYRPRKIDDIIDQDHVKQRIKEFIKMNDIPHLLFYGPPGVGKTTMALAIAYELYGDTWRENVLELNASDERGIAVIREKVKEFAKSRPTGGKVSFRLIILDEADNMTSDAQQALRRIMEVYYSTARFILIANYLSGIIEPIQSRCAVFRFSPLPKEAVIERLKYIASCEGVEVTQDGLEAIWEISQGDMRKAINILQAAAAASTKIDAEAVYRALGKASPSLMRALIQEALYGSFSEAMKKLEELFDVYCADPIDIVKTIHREIMSPYSSIKVPEHVKMKMIAIAGEFHYRILRGGDPRMQILGLLSKLRNIIRQYEKAA